MCRFFLKLNEGLHYVLQLSAGRGLPGAVERPDVILGYAFHLPVGQALQQVLCEGYCSVKRCQLCGSQAGWLSLACSDSLRKLKYGNIPKVREVQAVGGAPHDTVCNVAQLPISGHNRPIA